MHLRNGVQEPGMSSHKGHSRSGKQGRIGDPWWEGNISPHRKLWKGWDWKIIQSRAGKVDSSMEKWIPAWKSRFQHGKVSCVVCAGGGGATWSSQNPGCARMGSAGGRKRDILPNFCVHGESLTLFSPLECHRGNKSQVLLFPLSPDSQENPSQAFSWLNPPVLPEPFLG